MYNTIMFSDIALASLVIAIAYLLGSIPSAYIVGRLTKGVDIREVGDGRMGAAATYRRVGLAGGIIVGLMDLSKGAAAVVLAQGLGLPLPVVLLAGLAVVVGHNWSVFLHFKGGKGALTIYGVLASLMFWELLIALALGGIFYLITHKTGMSTGFLLGFLSLINWITGSLILLIILPVFISLPMVLKHISTLKAKAAAVTTAKSLRKKEG
jgi:glycerol-3-phosphate acyltransferase PlsY